MTQREVGYLFIGLGLGTVLAVAPLIAFVWFHHMFMIGYAWRPGSVILALPLPIVIGVAIVLRQKAKQNSN